MKITFISFLIIFSIFQVCGQERTNRQKIVFNKTSGAISKAIGWANNTEIGEWVDYENVISDNKKFKTEYKSLQGPYMMSRTDQSFKKLQVKTISFNEIEYYVLIVDKFSGKYEYPNIKEDWYQYKETIAYIYTKEEYQKLLNIESLVELKTKYSVSMGSKYEKYDETIFLDLIQTELSTNKNQYSSEYIFPFMKTKEGFIRFFLPSYSSDYNFNKEYFETDFVNFSNIIIK